MKKYEYLQKSPSAIYTRIPQDEDDHMRQTCSYVDELEYSAKMGIKEAIESGLSERREVVMYVLRKYRGHINPAIVVGIFEAMSIEVEDGIS